MQVEWLASGTAQIKVKSEIWNYIYHITINPKPVQYFTCSVPLWHECETYWYPEDEWYSYTVTNPGVVELDNKRHYYAALDERYSLLHIEWLQEWATFIYIHKNWDHVATIHTTIEAPVEAIRVENSDFDNKEWETTVTKIISWWWGYKVHEVNREELSVSVREDGSELTVKWLQPGTFYFTLKDQYNQTANFQVRVRDVNLELVKYELQLNPWQEEIVYFHEYYKGITKLVKNNENASIYLGDDEQGKYLKIVWQEEWITIFQVEDVQGNTKTGKITVWPGSVTEPENPGDPVEPEQVPEEGNTEDEEELNNFLNDLFNEFEIQEDAEGVEINSEESDEQGTLSEKIWPEIAGKIDLFLEKYENTIKDSVLNKLLVRLEELKEEKYSTKNKNIFRYLQLGFILIKMERESWVIFTEEEKKILKDQFKVYYDTTIHTLDNVAQEVVEKLIEINNQIPYELFVQEWQKLERFWWAWISFWSIVCVWWMTYAWTYAIATDGGLVLWWVVAWWACVTWWAIGASASVIWWAWVLMQAGWNFWRGTQWPVKKSNNQIQKDIERWKTPKDVDRIDYARLSEHEKVHIHFKKNDSALNIDWTWKHWSKLLSAEEVKWLKSIWWWLPK